MATKTTARVHPFESLSAIGPIRRGLVVVVWTERVDDVVRINLARWATKREAALYRR